MEDFWNALTTLYSVEFSYDGITVTFWQMNLFFILLALIVCFVRGMFD